DQTHSWGWKKILELRNEVKEHMIWKVGNGSQISVWFDKWSDFGVLFSHLSYTALYNARLGHDCILNDMIDDNGWKWPVEWYELFPQICQEVKFTVKQAYLDLTTDYLVAKWYKLSWFTQYWDDTIEELSNKQNGNNILSIVRRLCFAANVYHMWQERNSRLFKDESSKWENVFQKIVDNVKLKLMGLKVVYTSAIKNVEDKWNIQFQKMVTTMIFLQKFEVLTSVSILCKMYNFDILFQFSQWMALYLGLCSLFLLESNSHV
ncbi:hypothetical protein Tco_0963699, partial [Tanacetum coccineum]